MYYKVLYHYAIKQVSAYYACHLALLHLYYWKKFALKILIANARDTTPKNLVMACSPVSPTFLSI
jgi:hypothetical protein